MRLEMAAALKEIAARAGIGLVYKTSFDKANRTSAKSARGLGLDQALPIFSEIRDKLKVPVLTDVHEAEQCARVAPAVDVLQIPAFLCRQTDLLIAAAKTGKVVNVKKGQFLAPWDMPNVVEKITGAGNRNVLVTERGVSFGYNTLVSDMRAIPILKRDDAGARDLRCHAFGAAAGRAGRHIGWRARVRARACARGRRGRRRRRIHRDPSGSRQGAVRWPQHAAAEGDGAAIAHARSSSIGWQSAEAREIEIFMGRVLNLMAFVIFATTLFMRSVDPVIPQIASGLNVTPTTAALLSTGFTLPYALVQPVLGALGGHVQQDTADCGLHAHRRHRHTCMRPGHEFRNADDSARRRRHRRRRRFSDCAGGRRRPRAGAAAAGCDRPAAVRGHERAICWVPPAPA